MILFMQPLCAFPQLVCLWQMLVLLLWVEAICLAAEARVPTRFETQRFAQKPAGRWIHPANNFNVVDQTVLRRVVPLVMDSVPARRRDPAGV